VEHDVKELKVSMDVARDIYGVVIDPKTLQLELAATESCRNDLRDRRRKMAELGTNPHPTIGDARMKDALPVQRVDDNLVIKEHLGELLFTCAHCGSIICKQDENYLDNLACHQGPSSEGGPHIWPYPERYVDKSVVFRQYYCRGCYTALLTQVVPADHPQGVDKDVTVQGKGNPVP
jgi:N-methylhydantoinase B